MTMKKVLTLPLLFFSFIAFAQVRELPVNSEGDVEFTEVVSVGGLTSNQLYDNAKEWAAKTFYDYKAALQFEDDKSGKLIFKWASDIPGRKRNDNVVTEYMIDYTIILECKDGRYRYKINQINTVTVNKTMDFYSNTEISRTTDSKPISNSYDKIEELKEKQKGHEEIKALRPEVKRTIRKGHEKEIGKVKAELLKQIDFYNLQLKAIDDLTESLKKAMKKNDDNF